MSDPIEAIDGARAQSFVLRERDRSLRFGDDVVNSAAGTLRDAGFDRFTLLSTDRALAQAPDGLVAAADAVLAVRPGAVPEIAAELLQDVAASPLVALGGGRVVDVAKAIAAVGGLRCAAIPTTLAGSTFTPFHRLPEGMRPVACIAPSLALCAPRLMASAPPAELAATAMNALAHGVEALYAPGANPLAEAVALRGIGALGEGLVSEPPAPRPLALGALLAGWAIGTTGLSLHHALCQTIVRTQGCPHAQTNTVVLAHSVALVASRAPRELGLVAQALGHDDDPQQASAAIAALARRSGIRGLAALGVDRSALEEIAAAALSHPAIAGDVSRSDLLGVLEASL